MPAPRGLVQRLDQELHKSGLLPRGAKLLVAVSGGADSVALLRLLSEINGSDYWGWELVVGHVEHGIRGAKGVEDAVWVGELARELGLASEMRALHLQANCPEALARARRYRALLEMVDARDCAGVVLAHHADDQAETVLMRIFRGCGVDGLRGMAEETKIGGRGAEEGERRRASGGRSGGALTVWRPLLGFRRAELRAFLEAIAQPWREDASNQSMDYLRNRVRGQVLPVIESVWPRGAESLGRLSRIAREAQEVLDSEAAKLWAGARRMDSPGRIEFRRETLRQAFPVLVANVLRGALVVLWGTNETAGYERITEAVHLIQGTQGGKQIQMGGSVVVELDGDVVRVAVRQNDGHTGRQAGQHSASGQNEGGLNGIE